MDQCVDIINSRQYRYIFIVNMNEALMAGSATEIQHKEQAPKINYISNASALSKLSFSWISPLISYGNQHGLTLDNLEDLSAEEKSAAVYQKWEENWKSESKINTKNPLGKSIRTTFMNRFLVGFIFDFFAYQMTILTPLIVYFIAKYLDRCYSHHNIPDSTEQCTSSEAVFWLLITPLIRYLRSFSDAHASYRLTVLGSDIANSVALGMTNKSLKYSVLCNKKFKMGEISSLLQVDCFRLGMFPKHFSAVIYIIYVISFGIAFMAVLVGPAFLSGVGVILIASIVNMIVGRFTSRYQKQIAEKTDERMKVTSQVFNNIKFVKVNAWEEYFYDKLMNRRSEELKWYQKKFYSQTLATYSMWLVPKLILAATFGTYVALGHSLTPPIAFSIMCLYGYIQFYLSFLPTSLSIVMESFNAILRIQNFLQAEQIDQSCITFHKYEASEVSNSITVENGNFYWDKEAVGPQNPNDNVLNLIDINFNVRKGQMVAIIGDIGSGKSSLMYSLLGEMKYKPNTGKPRVTINGSMALVTQKPWIVNDTVRNNILFGKEYDRKKYRDVINYACLKRDFELFTHGDKTMIGEKGATLSGGQKARISFARALYSDADILLLDDLLSAVDVHVGKFLMTESLMKYVESKTRVLITHALYYLKYVDKVLIMEAGRIVEQGSYDQIRTSARFKEIYSMMMKEEKKRRSSSINLLEIEAAEKDGEGGEVEEKLVVAQLQKQASIHSRKSKIAAINIEKLDKAKSVLPKAAPPKPQPVVEEKEDDPASSAINELMMAEEVAAGDASFDLYKAYSKYNGGYWFLFLVLFIQTVWMFFNALSNVWITFWTTKEGTPEGHDNDYYLNYYIILGVMYGTTAFLRNLLVAYTSPKMSNRIHQAMISNLLFASLNEFFDRVPLGRIFNRLSKDLNSVDSNIPAFFQNALVFVFFLLTNTIIILYVAPIYIFLPVIILYLILCFLLKRYYSKSSKQLTRIEGITKSPIVSCFSEILSGVTTIRSYEANQMFFKNNSDKIDSNKKPIIACKATEVWFTIRLTLLSFIINMTALAYVLFGIAKSSHIQAPAQGALLLICTLGFDQIMYFMLINVGNFQSELISLQRCQVFMKIEPERGYVAYLQNRDKLKLQSKERRRVRPGGWPANGKIEFTDFKCRYRKNLDLVLRGLNVTFQGGHKIGVVGRTGSGKSTIMMCLLRILEAADGKIVLDDKDIALLSLDDLRSKITIILQDPCLFAGTIRENLDPLCEYGDEQLLRSLELCALKEVFQDRGGLNATISENGENLSVGERQLVSIARAILKPTKIVLVDQATANIDVRTESVIYKAMNEGFKNSTVITVAHRLNTVINSDRILVLEGGLLKEYDNPQQLLKNPNSFFAQLYNQSQKQNKM